ncbi:MAG: biopolymer transporter ExbD, partial [Verrucomicrobiota bacterium]
KILHAPGGQCLMADFRSQAGFEEDEEDIDISPLIDCVFILLIFFIVTAVFNEKPDVEGLSKVKTATINKLDPYSIILAVTPEGTIVHGKDAIGLGGIQPLVRRKLQKKDYIDVILQFDANTPADLLVRAQGEAVLAGARKVTYATESES